MFIPSISKSIDLSEVLYLLNVIRKSTNPVFTDSSIGWLISTSTKYSISFLRVHKMTLDKSREFLQCLDMTHMPDIKHFVFGFNIEQKCELGLQSLINKNINQKKQKGLLELKTNLGINKMVSKGNEKIYFYDLKKNYVEGQLADKKTNGLIQVV